MKTSLRIEGRRTYEAIISNVIKEQIYFEYERMLENWTVGYEEIDIKNEFGITHVILAGNEKNMPMIFLHDTTANSPFTWSSNINVLSNQYFCILIDMIGSPGKSTPGKSYNDKFSPFAWLDSILMELNIEKCFAIGVGLGADILLDYMIYNPEIKKLVCIEGGIKVHKDNTILPTIGLESMILSTKSLQKKIDKHIKSDENFFYLNENILHSICLLVKGYNHLAIKYQKSKDLYLADTKLIRNKLFFIFGENGIEDNAEAVNQILNDNLSYKIIENSGRLVNIEKAEIVNSITIDFLEGMKSV